MTPAAPPEWAIRALSGVHDPCCEEKGISVVDGHARVELLLTSGWCPFAARVLTDVEDAIRAQPGIASCEAEVVWDEAWTTDRLSPSARGKLRFLPDPVAVPDRDAYLTAHRPQARRAAP